MTTNQKLEKLKQLTPDFGYLHLKNDQVWKEESKTIFNVPQLSLANLNRATQEALDYFSQLGVYSELVTTTVLYDEIEGEHELEFTAEVPASKFDYNHIDKAYALIEKAKDREEALDILDRNDFRAYSKQPYQEIYEALTIYNKHVNETLEEFTEATGPYLEQYGVR